MTDDLSKDNNNVLTWMKTKKTYNHLYNQLIICLTFIISYIYIYDIKLDLNGDNFEYLNLAKSIVEGKGYSFLYSPNHAPTNWFPPGYSGILAFTTFFTGKNILVFKILNGLFFLGSLLLVYNIIRKLTISIPLAFSVTILIVLNSGLLRFSTIIMSEMPYLFFSLLTFYYLVQLKDELAFWKSKYFYGALLSAVAAYYIRSIGIVLLGAIVIHWLLEKKWKQVIVFISGFIILYLPWLIRNSLLDVKSRYLNTMLTVNAWRPEQGQINSVSDFISKMKINFYDTVIKGFTEVLFPFIKLYEMPSLMIILAGSIVVAVTFLGAWKIKKYNSLFIFYLIGNIFVFMIWHGGNFSRYVLPLAPFIAFCFFYGIYILISYFSERKGKSTPKFLPYSFLSFSIFFIFGLKDIHEMAMEKGYDPAYKNYFDIAEQIKKLDNPNLIVACRKPGMFYYYANCYAVNYLDSESDREIFTDFIDKKVDYLVLDKLGYSSVYRYLRPAVEKNQDLFQVVYYLQNPNTFLLKFDIEKAKARFK